MDKRYQVFVSSTYNDLKKERMEVIQALLELDCIPAGMELFSAADEDQWTLIKEVIDICDYYVVIVAGRYGSVTPEGISYTQKEYEYAINTNKPTIAFLHENPESIPSNKTEQDPDKKIKLADFRKQLEQKVCKKWSSPEDLGGKVSRSLVNLIRKHPAIGWVRADNVPDESSTKEILRMRKRIEELENQLQELSTKAPKGTEDLAQGEDMFQVYFSYRFFDESETKYKSSVSNVDITWNSIFSLIAPILVGECTETDIMISINNLIEIATYKKLRTKHSTNEVDQIRIIGDYFYTIIIQLKSLGLIIQGSRKRIAADQNKYWVLTPYGDTVITKLRAIRKSTKR